MRHAVLLSIVCIALAVSAPAASATATSHHVTLTRAERRAIVAAPHPWLRKVCPKSIGITSFGASRTIVAGRSVIIAQPNCQGTTGTTTETSVYASRRGRLHQLYRLVSGRDIERGRWSIAALSYTVHGRRVDMRYGGFRRTDPVCCPSRHYHRTFRLFPHRFVRGPLIRGR